LDVFVAAFFGAGAAAVLLFFTAMVGASSLEVQRG